MKLDPAATPCFILAGGLGTRIRSVEARPKALIPLAGVPFLAFLLRLLRIQGYRRVVLLLGHGADDIERVLLQIEDPQAFDPRYDSRLGAWLAGLRKDMDILVVREDEPLGTGGAVGLAKGYASSFNLVLNGDSYAEIVLSDVAETVRGDDGGSLAAVWMRDRSDYGGVTLGDRNQVTSFVEKGRSDGGWINGGVYVLPGAVIQELPEGRSSLERDVLPRLVTEGRLSAATSRCYFRDIGTPERLQAARKEFEVFSKRMDDGGEW